VVLDKRGHRVAGESKEQALARAVRSGNAETVKKVIPTSFNAKKLEEDTEHFGTPQTVGKDFSKALQMARMAKKITQADLAKSLNEKPTIIQEYESGKAVPNPQFIVRLERALGTKLPRPPKPAKKPNLDDN
jgi:putative transcription factor